MHHTRDSSVVVRCEHIWTFELVSVQIGVVKCSVPVQKIGGWIAAAAVIVSLDPSIPCTYVCSEVTGSLNVQFIGGYMYIQIHPSPTMHYHRVPF